MTNELLTLFKIVALVMGIRLFFRTAWGDQVGQFFPVPFWVYFLSILFSTIGFLPQQSPLYSIFSSHVLAAALFLMLIGAPVRELLKMGSQATLAMFLASASVFASAIIAFAVLSLWLPPEGPAAIGALLGTWIGGSANMVAVKEILGLPDETMGSLVLVDTILSYSWMALLLIGVRFQHRFDRNLASPENDAPRALQSAPAPLLSSVVWSIVIGLITAEGAVFIGRYLGEHSTLLTASAWTLLLATVSGTCLAATKFQKLTGKVSSDIGSYLLYSVLVTIGAKSSLKFTAGLPIYFGAGALIFILHGLLLFIIGQKLRVPLSLLATASQANIGGSISAPILAEAYRPGTAHFGVLMGIAGVLIGTYLGSLGGVICQWIRTFL